MVVDLKIRQIYKDIQKQLFYIIPEKWNKLYLYFSISKKINSLEMGELYFYYYPKGLLKKNPVNVYEIPLRFSLEEKEFLQLVDKLYFKMKQLLSLNYKLHNEVYDSIIISIENYKFNVDYFTNKNVLYNSYEKHLIFRYEYLKMPISCFSSNEKNIILNYILNKKKIKRNKNDIEPLYEKPFEIMDIVSKKNQIKYIKENDKYEDYDFKIKSQILKPRY